MNRAVIDASVVLTWYLADEVHGSRGLLLLERFLSGDLTLIAPSLLEYEVMSGLVIARRRGRIHDDVILEAAEGFMGLEIETKTLSGFVAEAIRICRTYRRSLYDASYVALAKKENIPLITADRELYEAMKNDFRQLLWLGDLE